MRNKKTILNSDISNKFIVYVDESGDHSLEQIDQDYPVFVLAFCIFYQKNYIENVVSEVERLKFEKFGHDIVILHEREIRRDLGVFKFRDKDDKQAFIQSLNDIIKESKFILIACIIDKKDIDLEASEDRNAYHIALGSCMNGLMDLLEEKSSQFPDLHIVFEKRGDKEDRELELEFRRICDGQNRRKQTLPFNIIFADKKVNSAGLQLADLVARPIGINHLRPGQPNRAFEILKKKFFCEGGRGNLGKNYINYGLRIYPDPKSEKPR